MEELINHPGELFLDYEGNIVKGEDVWTAIELELIYVDSRPWYVRIWHSLLFWKDTDRLMDKWWKPEEE